MTDCTPKERAMLLSAPMVRAVLDGTKTQTRRVMRPQPEESWSQHRDGPRESLGWSWPHRSGTHIPIGERLLAHCPFGQSGDRLWVRETWRYAGWTEDGIPKIEYAADGRTKFCHRVPEEWCERLEDIWAELSKPSNYGIDGRAADRHWRPSIHMPRWASRITLEITDVRAERLLDIREAGALAEGIIKHRRGGWHWEQPPAGIERSNHFGWRDPRFAFSVLWEMINGADSWRANPWVWVIEFRRATTTEPQDHQHSRRADRRARILL